MEETTNESYSYSGLDIRDFVKVSLVSIAKAQHALSVEQTRAMLETCFEYDKTTKVHKPIMLTMALTRALVVPADSPNALSTVQHFTSYFAIPLITIMPFNSLGIDVLNLDFNMEVTSQSTTTVNYAHTFTQKQETNCRVNLFGKIVTPPNTKSITPNSADTFGNSGLKIHIEAHAIPLTKGLLSIIDIYSNTLDPVTVNTPPLSETDTDVQISPKTT